VEGRRIGCGCFSRFETWKQLSRRHQSFGRKLSVHEERDDPLGDVAAGVVGGEGEVVLAGWRWNRKIDGPCGVRELGSLRRLVGPAAAEVALSRIESGAQGRAEQSLSLASLHAFCAPGSDRRSTI
jgi:hypothetical protein